MNKLKSNPLKSFKKVLDDTSSKIVTTYDTVSTQVASGIAETMPKLTQELQVIASNVTGSEIKIIPTNLTNSTIKSMPEIHMKLGALVENEKSSIGTSLGSDNTIEKLSAFENKIKPLYKGCYPDDPLNPSMPEYLGTVSNSVECIRLGKLNNFKYVGVQQGDKCFGSNFIPTVEPVEKNLYCNVSCSNPNSGTCGGYYYNQIFSTETSNQFPELNKIIMEENKINSLPKDIIKSELSYPNTNLSNVSNIIEKFTELNSDANKIGLLLNKCVKKNPIDSFILFIWVIILLLLICVLIDYLYSRKNTK